MDRLVDYIIPYEVTRQMRSKTHLLISLISLLAILTAPDLAQTPTNAVQYANTFATGGDGSRPNPWTSPSGTGGIQEAIKGATGLIHVPSGYYQIDKTINLTANSSTGFGTSSPVNPIILDGDSRGKTFLVGNTGGIVIDGTGRGAITLRDFTIIRGSSNRSTIGIYMARAGLKQSQFSEDNVIENIYCELGTVPTANMNKGTVCAYDFAAEGARFINDEFLADNPLVLTGENQFEITSPYQTVLTRIPFISQSVISGGFYNAEGVTTGQAIMLQGRSDNTRIENVTTEYIGATVIPAVRIIPEAGAPTTPIRNINIVSLQAESPATQAAQAIVTTATLQGLKLSGTLTNNGSSTPIVLLSGANAKLLNSEINIIPGNGGTASVLVGDGGVASGGILGGTIFLNPIQTISLTNAASGCNAVQFSASYSNPSITCTNVASSFTGMLNTFNGVTINSGHGGGSTYNANTMHSFNVGGSSGLRINSNFIFLDKSVALTERSAPTPGTGLELCYGDSTAHALKCSYNGGSLLQIPQVIASGRSIFTTTPVRAGACETTITMAAGAAAVTDSIETAYASAPGAATDSLLILNKWVTSGNVNFSRCNPTGSSITPTALVLNWRVIR
jgi:hypothetical protein